MSECLRIFEHRSAIIPADNIQSLCDEQGKDGWACCAVSLGITITGTLILANGQPQQVPGALVVFVREKATS